MIVNNMFMSFSSMSDNIIELKQEREKLISLKMKMINSKNELINSNLSGKTYEESVYDNEVFIKKINKKINMFSAYIITLEKACGLFHQEYDDVKDSVRG